MEEVTLVFPHQLFADNPALSARRKVLLIEDELFFNQYSFHFQKLVLHRASMKFFEGQLRKRKFEVDYFDSGVGILEKVIGSLKDSNVRVIHLCDPHDYLLERRINRFTQRHGISVKCYESPGFLCSPEYLQSYFKDRQRFYLNEFYIDQRKRLDILLEYGQPAGGKWNFDAENRKKMPSSVQPPQLISFSVKRELTEAQQYVKTKFSGNYGDAERFSYPICREDALLWMDAFFEERLYNYGIYQDAIVAGNSTLFHSVLTPSLNIGLITPDEILDRAIVAAERMSVPLNSIEGFCRQVMGWREYIRGVYILEGARQRTNNHFGHTGKIPKSFWTGDTGIEPVDNVIRKALRTAYSNHIERLMVIGNFMLLCEFNPNDVYKWFMELFIDAYDWVMVPNVYGMSQYADGGLMSTKPYISGSNYILKMSDFRKGAWCDVWDSLYWRFIDKHKLEFAKNHRMAMMVRQLERIDGSRMKELRFKCDSFLSNLS